MVQYSLDHHRGDARLAEFDQPSKGADQSLADSLQVQAFHGRRDRRGPALLECEEGCCVHPQPCVGHDVTALEAQRHHDSTHQVPPI